MHMFVSTSRVFGSVEQFECQFCGCGIMWSEETSDEFPRRCGEKDILKSKMYKTRQLRYQVLKF